MSEKIVLNGPAEFEAKVFVINDKTKQQGQVTLGLSVLEYPTPEAIRVALEKLENDEMKGALEGFRLMTKKEAWDFVMEEKTGQTFALPGGEEWDPI
jgi:hypothetical protein